MVLYVVGLACDVGLIFLACDAGLAFGLISALSLAASLSMTSVLVLA